MQSVGVDLIEIWRIEAVLGRWGPQKKTSNIVTFSVSRCFFVSFCLVHFFIDFGGPNRSKIDDFGRWPMWLKYCR